MSKSGFAFIAVGICSSPSSNQCLKNLTSSTRYRTLTRRKEALLSECLHTFVWLVYRMGWNMKEVRRCWSLFRVKGETG